MPLTRRRITDPAALKALAHPARMALLSALMSEGPLTATRAAELVDESPSNCSWHLRKLAEHGFVRAAGGGTGRNRPWQAVNEALAWGEDAPDGDSDSDLTGQATDEAATDALVERELQRLRAARASRATEPAAWRVATGLVQAHVWLTAEEAQDAKDTLSRLLRTHAGRAGSPSSRPEGARLVSLVGWVVPSGPHRVGTPEGTAPDR